MRIIKQAEIVKNFTNFSCRPARRLLDSRRLLSNDSYKRAVFHAMFGRPHRFLPEKNN
jgi:hypothetical protein